ncbi:MAG: HAD-IIB family hydrolase [Pseudonocardia sp.]|nr:HAD-IIB family hydrolase [Pseudonocardia sp.]
MRPPGWKPRLIALDVDGTTIHQHSPPSARVVAAVRAAAEEAVVMICTGRTVIGVGGILDELRLTTGTTVCSNGAVVLDTATRSVAAIRTFDPAKAFMALRETFPGAHLGSEHVGVGQRVTEPFPDGILAGVVTVVPEEDLLARPTPKIIAYWPGHSPAETAERATLLDVPDATLTVDHELAWVTLVPAGVSKASALADVAAELGIEQEDVLAAGDGDNDRAMLRWAGHGVAMGQAPAEVRADADEVTATVVEDGLAVVLERYF